jgi:AAA15 family ATPase/GTPase
MIKNIKIENFKSIQSLDLDLGRLNVFIGANGSGKSNILEGIALGEAAISDKLANEFLGSRIRVTNFDLMQSAFEKQKFNGSINFTFTNDLGKELKLSISHVEGQLKTSYSEDSQYFSDLESIKTNSVNWEEKFFRFSNRAKEFAKNANLASYLIFAPENNLLRTFNEENNIRPLGVRGEGLFSHLIELNQENPKILLEISQNLELLDWFDGLEIPKDLMFTEKRINIKDRFLDNSLNVFSQRSANEGFLYLLFYFTLFISDKTPKFFAVDNIDNALNPKLGKRLIKVLAQLSKEHQKQAILTTHNPAILDGLNLNDDEQRLFIVFRNGDGHTKVKRVIKKEMPEGVAPMPLSEMFLRGIIGGLPNNF